MIICALFLQEAGRAQINLVKNSDFELYNHCPDYSDGVTYCNNWTSLDSGWRAPDWAHDLSGVPEYCNRCTSSPVLTLPNNGNFYQYPHSGNGVMQVQMYYNETDTTEHYKRDYLQGSLKNVLISGKQYCVTFYVSLEEISAYAIDHIGAFLDDGSIDTTTHVTYPQTTHTPQVYAASIISDTLNWIKVQGTFTAIGNEKFITIGNLFDNAHTDTLRVYFPTGASVGNDRLSHYLVDDVSVIATDAVAYAGHDTLITTATTDSAFIGTNEGYIPCKWYKNGVLIDSNKSGFKVKPSATASYVMELDICGNVTRDTVKVTVWPVGISLPIRQFDKLLLYPNPNNGLLSIDGAANCEVKFYNVVGQNVWGSKLTTSKESINIELLSKGVYWTEIVDIVTGEKVTKLVIKE
jgi:hypothetical protein